MAIKEQTEKISIEFLSEIDNGITFVIKYYFNDSVNKYVIDIATMDGSIICNNIPFEVLCDSVDYVRSKSGKNFLSNNKIAMPRTSSLPMPSITLSNPAPAVSAAQKIDMTKEPIQLSVLGKKEQIIKEAEDIEIQSDEEIQEKETADNNEEVDIVEERKNAVEKTKESPPKSKMKRKED
jgi:hypothetical protein